MRGNASAFACASSGESWAAACVDAHQLQDRIRGLLDFLEVLGFQLFFQFLHERSGLDLALSCAAFCTQAGSSFWILMNLGRQAFQQGQCLRLRFDQRLALQKLAIGPQGFFALGDDAETHVLVGLTADSPGEDVDQRAAVVEHLRQVGFHRHARLSGPAAELEIRPLAGRPAHLLVLGQFLVNVVEQARLRIGRETRPMVFPEGHGRRRKVIVL